MNEWVTPEDSEQSPHRDETAGRDRQHLERAMEEGYVAEALESSLDPDWTKIETEGI